MNSILSILGNYLILAVTAISVENAVLGRALGVSRLISLVDDTTDTLVFTVLMTLSMTGAGALFYYANYLFLREQEYYSYLAPLVAIAAISVSFIAVLVLAKSVAPKKYTAKVSAAAPAAAFNVTVLGTLMLTTSQRMSLADTIVFGIGSALGFTLAVLLVTEGQRKLQNRDIPAAFRGLPATLLYLAGLSMAVYALAGHTLSL